MKLSTLTFCNPDYERNEFVKFGGAYDRVRRFCNLITLYADNMDGALFYSEYLSKTSLTGPLNYSLGRRAFMIHRDPEDQEEKEQPDLQISDWQLPLHSMDQAYAMINQSAKYPGVTALAYNRRRAPSLPEDLSHDKTRGGKCKEAPSPRYLDMDVIDTTWMDNNVHAIRHSYFNLNPTIVSILQRTSNVYLLTIVVPCPGGRPPSLDRAEKARSLASRTPQDHTRRERRSAFSRAEVQNETIVYMVRKTASWRTSVDTQSVRQQHRAAGKDVVVPLVLWNEAPQVQVAALHVLQLPVSQPSQNSSTLASEEDTSVNNEEDEEEDTRTQLCVFAGTLDGVVLYWRFEQDAVAQVNMLVLPGSEGSGQPVVGIVSGTDEWGQSTLVSATRDGALARWQLPNGACAEANASLAKELAPLLGLEMLCNRRFAVVVSEESRLMVLDTWRMQLLYCMDTAQEQIRRSIAVGELQMPRPKSPRPRLVRSSSGSGIETGYGPLGDQVIDNPSTSGRISPSRSSIAGGSPDSRRIATFLPSNVSIEQQHQQRWDAVVLSLGAEGLVKCFLWTQPRGSTSGTPFGVSEGGGSASVAWGFRWVQRSSWVISWADQADDITCSQSTSLKDGDNMNPQTALMGSIKSSYFPLSVHVSPDSSLVLLIWKTKFVILKRKWLCPLEIRSDGQAGNESFSKTRPTTGVGSCQILPVEFVRQAASSYGSKYLTSCSAGGGCGTVCWENGEFLEDGNVMLWTNTGHVFQFMTAESSADTAGRFFIFTKDQDQLVPRSDSKALRVIDKALYITSMDRCKCCDLLVHKDKCVQTKPRSSVTSRTGRRQQAGFTSCMKTGSSMLGSTLEVVHMCHRGTLGLWTMPAVRVPSPTRMIQNKGNIVAARMPPAENVRFHSLTDGFEAAAIVAQGEIIKDNTHIAPNYKGCLTHLIIGRDDARASSTYETVRRAGIRRKRRQDLNDALGSVGTGASITSTASSVLATALAPVTGRGGPPGVGGEPAQPEADESEQRRPEITEYRYLLDIPIVAKGYSDGMLCIGLLTQEHLPNGAATDSDTRLSCHTGRITALAHCFWGFGAGQTSTTTSSMSSFATQLSAPSIDDMNFATETNPFYMSRFPDPTFKRNSGARHLNIKSKEPADRDTLTIETPGQSGPNAALNRDSFDASLLSIRFMVFSGGTDGVMRVIELVLYRSAASDSLVQHEATTRQRFLYHRGAIQQISISPLKRGGIGADGSDWDSIYPDRLVATVGADNRIVIYAPQYKRHPSSRRSFARDALTGRHHGHIDVEWQCVLEFAEHGDQICNLDWQLERGLLQVECADRMVYVWSTDTGILERTVPCALLYGGGNSSGDGVIEESSSTSCPLVENSTLFIGNAVVQLIEFGVLRSAEQLKKNWSSYYASLYHGGARTDNSDDTLQSPGASVYATNSMELFMLSLLLSWGVTPAIDQSCRSILGIEPAHALYSCALQDFVSGALTIPVPWTTPVVPPIVVDDSSGRETVSTETVAVPAFARNWQHSSALSASIALGVVSLCMSCMEYKHPKSGNGSMSPTNKEEFQVLWSQLITQHSVVLPECVAQFREPALEELAAFGFDSCEYTQLAARTLLSGVIKRLPPNERSALSAEYSAKLHWEMVRLETETGSSFLGTVGGVGTSGGTSSSSQSGSNATGGSGNSTGASPEANLMSFSLVVERLGSLVLLMSMIGTYFPGEISPAGAREVCDILVFLLKAPERFVASVSAELLTKGLMLFRPHLVDLSSLIIQLLLIDMREKLRSAQSENGDEVSIGPGGSLANFNEGGTGGSNAAMSLLVEVGACESAFVLGLLQQEMHNHDRPPGFHESILLYMMELINTHYLLMCRHLPAFVDTIMACLDPTKPERRRRCLPLSTRCLHSLVRRFPMVDFHKETQRMALGTMEAVIVIYDLRTATKWRVLDGHASAVSAVRFRSDGQVLVSYAARDGSVRWWNSGNAGLFGGMLKMHQSCLKEHKLAALKENANGGAPASTGGASAGLKQIIQTSNVTCDRSSWPQPPQYQNSPSNSNGAAPVGGLRRQGLGPSRRGRGGAAGCAARVDGILQSEDLRRRREAESARTQLAQLQRERSTVKEEKEQAEDSGEEDDEPFAPVKKVVDTVTAEEEDEEDPNEDHELLNMADIMLIDILKWLDEDTIGACVCTCKRLMQVARSEVLFEALCRRIFPVQNPRAAAAAARNKFGLRRFATWFDMFHDRPRVRYNGFYWLKVSYYKKPELSMWTDIVPGTILKCIYYRYFSFQRDGTVLYGMLFKPPHEVESHIRAQRKGVYRGRFYVDKDELVVTVPTNCNEVNFRLKITQRERGKNVKLVLKEHFANSEPDGSGWVNYYDTADEEFYYYRSWNL
ncbi:unnamed protein product [Phytophthora lilii]|uniref:Unnamed protein product n=1 Tax=Phytophthora lilii TaxID=2077276 RepID=A0A9W6U357_9STRA|nr:unnamed protein product [Phytophthora lilii]